MNKDDLIGKIATNIGISKTDAAKSVDAVFSTITSTLKSGNEVRLVGLSNPSLAIKIALKNCCLKATQFRRAFISSSSVEVKLR